MTAEERALQLWDCEVETVHQVVIDYLDYTAKKYDNCFENKLAALSAYAQIIEGLKATESYYTATDADRAWFAAYKPVDEDF